MQVGSEVGALGEAETRLLGGSGCCPPGWGAAASCTRGSRVGPGPAKQGKADTLKEPAALDRQLHL